MVRNIVLCSDGTGSRGIQKRGTNVFKLFEAVDLHRHKKDPCLPKQIAFYDDGVGTENLKSLKILGGAFGLGLSRNVKQLYADLVRTYKRGDRIYLFGFSRGAFTVRTLSGLIMTCGIIDREKLNSDAELLEKVEMAYRKYRRKYRAFLDDRFREEYNKKWIVDFREKHSVVDKIHAPSGKVHIKFIGVWDTVDAVGLPIKWLADKMNEYIYCFKFVDLRLSKEVDKACHALSIDDERLTFHPTMWDEEGEEDKEDSRIEQVWFAGVHSNVGGGYPKHGMSLVSLDWMMSKAEQADLRFIDHDRQLYRRRKNVTDKLYNSRSGAGVYYRYRPRDIGDFCQEYVITPKIHNSVIERIKQRTEGYAPGNIPFKCKFVPTDWNYDKFIKAFREHTKKNSFKDKESLLLLDSVKKLVEKRCFYHYAFLFTSIIIVLFAACINLFANMPQLGLIGAFFNLIFGVGLIQLVKDLIFIPFIPSIPFIPFLPIVPVVFYLIVWRVRKKMNRDFSEFWYAILKKLK